MTTRQSKPHQRVRDQAEKDRIALIEHRRDLKYTRWETDPLRHYDSHTETPRLFELVSYRGEPQTQEQRLERIIQILWTRVSELEREVEALRSQ